MVKHFTKPQKEKLMDKCRKLENGLYILDGASLTGIVVSADSALLINAGNLKVLEFLKENKISKVDIYFTHHRRELAASLEAIKKEFNTRVFVPDAEKKLFTDAETYWKKPEHRWSLLCDHVPYHVTHIRNIDIAGTVAEGTEIKFGDWSLKVLSTPGFTDGSVSYIASKGNKKYAFTGDLIFSEGKVFNLYNLQQKNTVNGFELGDYHGFMGSCTAVIESMKKVLSENIDAIIPAHGEVMEDPEKAVKKLEKGFKKLFRNYVSISALRWYREVYFAPYSKDKQAMPMQETKAFPPEVEILIGNTWILKAESGRAILTDPYCKESIQKAEDAIKSGKVKGYDAIWLSHYHHDHMIEAETARQKFNCPIITDETMADVIENPKAYFLTCLVNYPAKVECPKKNGDTWVWENFTLTSYHLPGQTYYHSGLLAVTNNGTMLFFSGDSFSPTGIDDYCSWNRNFLGENKGYDRCIKLLMDIKPDYIFNQHINVAFNFTDKSYSKMLKTLEAREKLMAEILPWDNVNYGTDECWVNTYPYEQKAKSSSLLRIKVNIMNHSDIPKKASASIRGVPEGWTVLEKDISALIPATSEGHFEFKIRTGMEKGRFVIPVNLCYDGVNLGPFREFIVELD